MLDFQFPITNSYLNYSIKLSYSISFCHISKQAKLCCYCKGFEELKFVQKTTAWYK